MKNIPIVLAFVVSVCCYYILSKNVQKKDIESFQSNAVGIEIGVFKDVNFANNMQKRLGGYIIKDNDLYRIYYGIFKSENNIEFISDYLNNYNIYFYVKDLMLNESLLDELLKCEKNIIKEKDDLKKLNMTFDFLKKYEEVI